MVKHIKAKELSLPVGIAIGIIVCILVSVGSSMLISGLVDAGRLQPEDINTGIPVIHLIASFLGSWLAYLLTKQMRLIVSAITAGGYMLVLCGMTALVFGGEYQGFWLTLLMVGVGLMLSVIPGIKGRKGRIRKHKIPAYR